MILFHEFTISDVEDPELYAAHPLHEWQQTEKGKWIMEHSIDPTYSIRPNMETMGYKVVVYGQLRDKDLTYFNLKYK